MGTSIRVNGFKKEKHCITGEIKCLGLYEVNEDAIASFSIRKFPIEFWSIYIISETKKMFYDLDIQELGFRYIDFQFYDLLPSRVGGDNIRIVNEQVMVTMFEPTPILRLVKHILKYSNELVGSFSSWIIEEINRNEELKKLEDLKFLLEETIIEKGIIGINVG